MNQSIQVILLAGAIRPSPLRAMTGRPTPSLPLDRSTTILGAWARWLDRFVGEVDVVLATNEPSELATLHEAASSASARTGFRVDIRVVEDPAEFRGSAGVVADVHRHLGCQSDWTLVIECGCLPPMEVPATTALMYDDVAAAILTSPHMAPSGVYLIRSDLIPLIPDIGYFDLKEQLLPSLRSRQLRISRIAVREEPIRIRTPESYLRAIQSWKLRSFEGKSIPALPLGQGGAAGPKQIGACLIEDGAEVADDVLLHDAAILRGARVSSGAVISRSVVNGNAVIEPGSRVIRQVASQALTPHPLPVRVRGQSQFEAAAG